MLIYSFCSPFSTLLGQSLQSQAVCSAALCSSFFSWPQNSGYGCPAVPRCYKMRTSANKAICVPEGACQLFDRCSNTNTCASNLTTCIVDSCCPSPVCVPMAMINLCSQTLPTGMLNRIHFHFQLIIFLYTSLDPAEKEA